MRRYCSALAAWSSSKAASIAILRSLLANSACLPWLTSPAQRKKSERDNKCGSTQIKESCGFAIRSDQDVRSSKPALDFGDQKDGDQKGPKRLAQSDSDQASKFGCSNKNQRFRSTWSMRAIAWK